MHNDKDGTRHGKLIGEFQEETKKHIMITYTVNVFISINKKVKDFSIF